MDNNRNARKKQQEGTLQPVSWRGRLDGKAMVNDGERSDKSSSITIDHYYPLFSKPL